MVLASIQYVIGNMFLSKFFSCLFYKERTLQNLTFLLMGDPHFLLFWRFSKAESSTMLPAYFSWIQTLRKILVDCDA